MALARVRAMALTGLAGSLVDVEADIAQGLPSTTIIGLPDTALHEARDRVRAAVSNAGFGWPAQRITVALSPATLPKAGASFDLAIAAAVLSAAGQLSAALLADAVVLGELGLDGQVRGVPGILPAVLAARAAGIPRVVVPECNEAEARLVAGLAIWAVRHLRELAAPVEGPAPGPPPRCRHRASPAGPTWPTSSRSPRAGGPWRSARPAGTPSCWSGRPGQARRCSRSGCRGCCRR
jgi:magnesium chelatase family protein